MNSIRWQTFEKFLRLLAAEAPDTEQQSFRIRCMERNLGLPVKALVIGVLFYYLFYSRWFDTPTSAREIAMEVIQRFFLVYVLINVAGAILLVGMSQLPLSFIQWVVFVVALLDGLFLAGLTLVTGGFDSMLFWVFLGLIVRNAISVPVAPLQIMLNLLVSSCYVLAGLLDLQIAQFEMDQAQIEPMTEPFVLRIVLLFLMTLCCYGVQVLVDRQRRADEEAREYALRQEQLRVTSRLAAEIAHQLKNPLGIINNAAFNLQRNVKEGKATITQQIKIIREEVERSDRIITDMMGYARLAEGKLEKLNAIEELDWAIERVFPVAAHYAVQIERNYASVLPPLLMQRNHLSEIFLNLLQNAREAINGNGTVQVQARYGENYSVVVCIGDNGPGIPSELRDKIFEPYFTTKLKGSGLGLAIVKHNVEIYGGTVKVESEPGKGARFILQLPAKSLIKLRR
ncbi:MAG: ATP-binding protein [Candidatus Omnitrophica bacterium]|nr:ATP-binding protein [Candidatus Omnitrophota bacterium]